MESVTLGQHRHKGRICISQRMLIWNIAGNEVPSEVHLFRHLRAYCHELYHQKQWSSHLDYRWDPPAPLPSPNHTTPTHTPPHTHHPLTHDPSLLVMTPTVCHCKTTPWTSLLFLSANIGWVCLLRASGAKGPRHPRYWAFKQLTGDSIWIGGPDGGRGIGVNI